MTKRNVYKGKGSKKGRQEDRNTLMVIIAVTPVRQEEIKSQAVAVQVDRPPAGLRWKMSCVKDEEKTTDKLTWYELKILSCKCLHSFY